MKVITPQNRIQEYSTYLESPCHIIMPLVCGAHGYSPKVLWHLSWAKWIVSTTGLPSLIPRVGGIQPFDSLSDMFKTIIHIDTKVYYVFLYIYVYIYIYLWCNDMNDNIYLNVYIYIFINSRLGTWLITRMKSNHIIQTNLYHFVSYISHMTDI